MKGVSTGSISPEVSASFSPSQSKSKQQRSFSNCNGRKANVPGIEATHVLEESEARILIDDTLATKGLFTEAHIHSSSSDNNAFKKSSDNNVQAFSKPCSHNNVQVSSKACTIARDSSSSTNRKMHAKKMRHGARANSCLPVRRCSLLSGPWSLEWLYEHNHGDADIIFSTKK